jgi:hypothetical protein
MPELKLYKGIVPLWQYVPSKPAALAFAGLFLLATLFVLFRMVKSRTWFSMAMIFGGAFQTIGYCGRVMAEERTDELFPFAVQLIFILVAPALYAASVYMTLGRVIRSVKGEPLSIIPVRWLTRIFVLGDVVSFAVQVFGGGMASKEDSTPDDLKMAEHIIVAGLVVQIVIFGLFAVTAVLFDVRLRHSSDGFVAEELNPGWRGNMRMMYAVSLLIMVRSVFRVIEFVMGSESYLLKHEWPIYAFDAALMLLAILYYGWSYPSNLRVKKGGPGHWETVASAPGTSAGLEMHQQPLRPPRPGQQHMAQEDYYQIAQPYPPTKSHQPRGYDGYQ